MPSGMTRHENIAKALKARLSELMTRVGEIDSELRKPLSAISKSRQLTSKIRGRLKPLKILKFMKSIKFKRR